MRLTLLLSSLCLSLLSYTKTLNIHLCLNIIGDAAYKGPKDVYTSELPSLELTLDRLIGNGNSLPIFTTDQEISIPYNGTALQ